MKKIAILFVLGIFLPALVLGVLALQSARQQGVLIADQEAKLRQQEADNLSTQVQLAVRIEHEAFVKLVQELVESGDPESVARDFNHILQTRRPGKGLGFSVSTAGQIYSPSPVQGGSGAATANDEYEFITQNSGFLRGRISAEVYPTVSESLADVQQAIQWRGKSNTLNRQDENKKAEALKPQALAKDQAQLNSSNNFKAFANTQSPPQREETAAVSAPAVPAPAAAPAATAEQNISTTSGSFSPVVREKTSVAKEAPRAQIAMGDGTAYQDKDRSLQGKSDQMSPATQDEKKQLQEEVAKQKESVSEERDGSLLNTVSQIYNRSEFARKVAPQRVQTNAYENEKTKLMSNLMVSNSRFVDLVSKESSGILSRFVDDRLEIMFWVRPEKRPDIVFGMRVLPEEFRSAITRVMEEELPEKNLVVAAVLDDRTRPFARSDAAFNAKWQQPFVASEVGEVLPHWEVGLYLRDAGRLGRTARITSLTIMGLIALALGAIALGGGLVVVDMRRQLALVKKKTDFVSNVSHELKTPLTSIRMFAELLQQDSVPDPEKRSHYLRIITVEAERLTRLINNVLDFARMERNQKVYHKESIDFHEVIRQVWESQELHLNQQGFSTSWQAESPPYPVFADADALAQILVNLISNAEKYSGELKEVELQSYQIDGQVRVSVLDRGMGVPAGEEKKIFEHFYRAHDSLSSGIQGSGLGLTLAQKIARDHGGSIVCEMRKDGGTRFTLQLPLIKSDSPNSL